MYGVIDNYPSEWSQVIRTATAASTGPATSRNRWLFSGKETQSFLNAGIPLLDFGARMYDPTTAHWTAADPLAEKYYGVSPYAYCLGNPISIIDPDGMDNWTIDERGNVVWTGKSDDHRLYYVNNDGVLSDDYVSVSDRSILDDLTVTGVKVEGGAERNPFFKATKCTPAPEEDDLRAIQICLNKDKTFCPMFSYYITPSEDITMQLLVYFYSILLR